MAKIRVYELAKELNLKNKALLDRLVEMKVSVSSHMTSLEDDVVEKIRADISAKKGETSKEAREKPTVIRKRRKRPSDKASHPRSDASGRGDRSGRPDRAPADANPEKGVFSGKPESGNRKSADARDAGKPGMTETGSKNESHAPGRRRRSGAAKTGDGATESSPRVPARQSEKSDRMSESSDSPEKRARKKRKRKKKAPKDMPAKIIKLPPVPEEKPPEPEKKAEPEYIPETVAEEKTAPIPVAETADALPSEPSPVSKKKKSRKKGSEESVAGEDEKENRWAKKKISFKRKEVVEGADLYAGGKGRKGKKAKGKVIKLQKTQITTPKAIKRRIRVDETIVLSDLAKRMGIKAGEMIKKLMMMGVMVTVNQTIDYDTAVLVATEFGYEVEKAAFEEGSILNIEHGDDPDKMTHRPPVVTIMGHVDHGKTSLLDVIRKTRITEIEAGGITQHIGAYSVSTNRGQITFLDTPGHEAFTAMRARGATVTDIVVLVVAADDGVMPQTIEAINHAKAAHVPIIVAINKMDKPGADPERIQRELADQGLMSEEWGGDTIFVKVSAKKNTGIDGLLEMILLQAEVLELRANHEKHAKGYVVESKLDSGRGPVATVLIQEGTLRAGDPIVCGVHHGRIRAMLNDVGQQVDAAGPSEPVEILGLSGVPNAGDEMLVLDDDKSAKQVSEHRVQKQRSVELAKTSRISLEKLFERMQQGEMKELNIIVKADVHGSIEALNDSLVKLSNKEVTIRVIHSATGTVSESDVSLAAVSNAIIIGFNVRPSVKIQAMANEEHVDMRFYNIIYNVIKDVKDAIVGMMESKFEERIMGMAEVRQVFHVPKVGMVAGSYVTDGKIQRGLKLRLIRDGVIVHEGNISSLRRFKDDAKEVQSGYECGIGIENYNDIKVGDVFECFYMEEIKPEIQ
ncbi:MAG: translation initiation factor IF-2 [Desulfococcaceae bacterium]